MRGTNLRLLAAGALVAGVAGCSLPHVLPTQVGPTSGPSPYGVWYEQHWATNSVLLAASDNPEVEVQVEDDTAIEGVSAEETSPEERAEAAQQAIDEMDAAVNASADASEEAAQAAEDFSNSSPYQFPAEAFRPAPEAAATVDPSTPTTGGPIRY